MELTSTRGFGATDPSPLFSFPKTLGPHDKFLSVTLLDHATHEAGLTPFKIFLLWIHGTRNRHQHEVNQQAGKKET
jgi:hypothetical protein